MPSAEAPFVTLDLPADDLAAFDAAWRRHGFPSRRDFVRHAFALALIDLGETGTAKRFGRTTGEEG